MDTYEGSIADPISLHKYLYANANPVNYTDPSGHYTMMDMSMAMDLKATLSNIQVDTYSYIQDALTSSWDGNSFSKTPEIGLTTIGLNLLLRFSPRLKKATKLCDNSFANKTLVATENGLKPIEDIKIGDKVWTYNEANKSKSLEEVTHIIKRKANKNLVDINFTKGEIITTTNNHPFWEQNSNSWKVAKSLRKIGVR